MIIFCYPGSDWPIVLELGAAQDIELSSACRAALYPLHSGKKYTSLITMNKLIGNNIVKYQIKSMISYPALVRTGWSTGSTILTAWVHWPKAVLVSCQISCSFFSWAAWGQRPGCDWLDRNCIGKPEASIEISPQGTDGGLSIHWSYNDHH